MAFFEIFHILKMFENFQKFLKKIRKFMFLKIFDFSISERYKGDRIFRNFVQNFRKFCPLSGKFCPSPISKLPKPFFLNMSLFVNSIKPPKMERKYQMGKYEIVNLVVVLFLIKLTG
jgi:hypothetical protein